MNFYVDFHDVIAAYVPMMICKYGWPEKLDAWTLTEMFPWVNFAVHFSEPNHSHFVEDLPMISGAAVGLDALSRIGYVIIVSATKPQSESEYVTREWLRRHFLDNYDFVCVGGAMEKVAWIEEELSLWGAAVIIDDHPEVLSQCRLLGDSLMVVRFDAPWNRSLMDIPAIKSWYSAADAIKRLRNE